MAATKTAAIADYSAQLALRHQCRVDLFFLCKVLGYRDVDPEVHGPVVSKLQQFQGGTDDISSGSIIYTPKVSLWELRGPRRQLFLDPRGHLKTTIISQAHVIQWILNYPDIRILITTATSDLAEKILREIKAHFQFNEMFRYLFPDYCPESKKVGEFGNLEQFTVQNRQRKAMREPTCSTSSVGKVIAGSHYEVLICSDMVDKETVKTPAAIRDTIEHFRYMNPLLERSAIPPHSGWIVVEGTRYDFGDLYGFIIDNNEQKAESERWQVHLRSAIVDEAREITLWPSRYPWTEIKAMELDMGPGLFSAQMLNRPIPASGGLATLDDLVGIWLPRAEITAGLRSMNLHCTVDLAAMDDKREGGDFIVLTVAGFDRQGQMVIVDIRRGHFSETEVIDQFYFLARLYPDLLDFKVEREAYWRTLAPFLKREQFKRGFLPPIIDLKRDNQKSKEQRIRGLQPWFKGRLIRIAADLPCRSALIEEITRFPSRGVHDDILDTIADQLQNREGTVNSDVVPAPWEPKIGKVPGPWELPASFVEFDPITHEARFVGQASGDPSQNYDRNGI